MSFYWQPKIDQWIPESYAGNTEHNREPHLNVPPPHLTDMVSQSNYAAGESEEMKVKVTGFGDMSIKELQSKIVEILDDIISIAKKDSEADAGALEQKLYNSPELENLVKQYAKHRKLLAASEK